MYACVEPQSGEIIWPMSLRKPKPFRSEARSKGFTTEPQRSPRFQIRSNVTNSFCPRPQARGEGSHELSF